MDGQLLTWADLTSFSELVIGTTIITAFIKDIIKKIPTQVTSVAVAAVLLGLGGLATGAITNIADAALIPINGIFISLAANGAYSVTTRGFDKNITLVNKES